MTSRSRFDCRGFGFIGVLLMLMLASVGGTSIYMMTRSPASTRGFKTTTDRATRLRVALASYRLNHGGSLTGSYPAALTSLATTDGVACAANITPLSPLFLTLQGWCGPYIDQIFSQDPNGYSTDGWGTAFALNSTSGVLTSCGPDLSCGTSDDLTFSP